MRYLIVAALLLSCAGCATRTVAVSYNPARVDAGALPRIAEQECRKHGMVADYQGGAFWTAYGYQSDHYWCRPVQSEPFGWWTWPRAEY
jgi:hypothetical protein